MGVRPATAEQGRRAALALIEVANRLSSREALAEESFRLLDRLIGFDRGELLSREGAPTLAFDAHTAQLTYCSCQPCGAALFDAAESGEPGVFTWRSQPSEPLPLTAAEPSALQPSAAHAGLGLLAHTRGRTTQVLSLVRLGAAARFQLRELAVARCLQPALSLALRAVPEIEASVAGPPLDDACPLTPREREIVGLVGRGLQNPEIAMVCGTSTHTVRNQLAKVFRKLEVSTRAELVSCAVRHGLLQCEAPE